MDLPYLRAHPHHLPTLLFHQRIRETPVGGGSICQARRLTLEDGNSIFVKSMNDPADRSPNRPVPPGLFEAEAAGLRWLAEPGAVAVPEVIGVLPDLLIMTWVDPAAPSPLAAERFGARLAGVHRAGADWFGAPWPGYIGSLPQPNDQRPAGDGSGWAAWFAEHRLRPHLRTSRDRGALTAADAELIDGLLANLDRYAPPAEPAARLHGDLWPGNLLWAADGQVYLIDPSAHGGHRETDLAQLALFGGAPYLDQILAGYQQVWPLATGWRERIPLHQLHLLLVHTALFGASYRETVLAATRAALRTG
ncbi:MAG TPA: fructosamine kinase family protein [Micromonosporaceae bacterium]